MQTKKQLRERVEELEAHLAGEMLIVDAHEETIELLLNKLGGYELLKQAATEQTRSLISARQLIRELSKEVVALGGTVTDYTGTSS